MIWRVASAILLLLGAQAFCKEIASIEVSAKRQSETFKEVAKEKIKSADLAEALTRQSASVWMVRRSGIANDVIVRAQRKDNINITIDGAKIYGACPNRMDPPISHILSNNVESIKLLPGPFNVEDFGTLSADVKIETPKPDVNKQSELFVNLGSFGYKKADLHLYGGNDTLQYLLSLSSESSGQYKDGNGRTLSEQVDHFIATHKIGNTTHDMMLEARSYLPRFKDLDAFVKKTAPVKLNLKIDATQELNLSYTANRSDTILYPNTPMDADYDDSDILTLDYGMKGLGRFSDLFTFELYGSKVDHPMALRYRNSVKKKALFVIGLRARPKEPS